MRGLRRVLRRVWMGAGGLEEAQYSPHKLRPTVSQLTKHLSPPNKPDESKSQPSLNNEQRLGDVIWKPAQEFPGCSTIDRHAMTLDRELQVLRRIARVSVRSIAQPARLVLLGVCSSGVLGLSAYEAQLLLDSTQPLTADTALFVYKYATQNFLASCIWDTRSAELVAQSLALDPTQLLRELNPATSSADAALQLCVMNIFTARSMVAGFMVVTQLLTIVRASGTAALGYLENVYNGREPPLQGIEERIIRLAGKGSDVTEVSMARNGSGSIIEDKRHNTDENVKILHNKKDSSSAESTSDNSTEAKSKCGEKDGDKGSKVNTKDDKETVTKNKKPEKLPRLLYYPTTVATINAVHATLTSGDGVSDPRRCCVLINEPFGLEHLDELAEGAGEKFHPVCAAEIYDDYFRQVRIWTRMGHSAAVIQHELDQRFESLRDILDAITALDRATCRV
ncbi:hypothetical protein BBO99_00000566 [Phytophthora kernoviae]|uniref:Uncharacterized protein n=2 Tax=Phytophthora kernoviae TaxID=325452 RepID=A0A3R7H391_9STRA|nr:hypothetical protein G195_001447 [Phytophthora kernoviae 00238/432]KAG2532117.1 hypothetical protein JM16_000496 [Phytophthora kernoviae]KAG2533143.1 hypothetical protein JM18_000577 [Phytophthora kernoviae]RLN26064.1 hypothetical protein BBI17_000605 [Phytophthora kernoviae]RLN85488.1 hypothetical protein BBO99_00000566 [Phytophthora kernoviae]